jgi:hypothetical protein
VAEHLLVRFRFFRRKFFFAKQSQFARLPVEGADRRRGLPVMSLGGQNLSRGRSLRAQRRGCPRESFPEYAAYQQRTARLLPGIY